MRLCEGIDDFTDIKFDIKFASSIALKFTSV